MDVASIFYFEIEGSHLRKQPDRTHAERQMTTTTTQSRKRI